MLKYPWFKGNNPSKPKKWGAYRSESKDFEFASKLISQTNTRTIEANLMDWADDITYSVHDLEDFYRAVNSTAQHLLADRRYDKERRGFFEAAFRRHPNNEEIWSDHHALEEAFNEVIIGLFPLEGPYTGKWTERAALCDFTSQMIGRYIGATQLKMDGSQEVVEIDPARELEVAMLKELTWVYVIELHSLAAQQEGQREVIETLFRFYLDASLGRRQATIFTPYYRQALDDAWYDGQKKRVVIDLIAGMTEAQALAMSNRLRGVSGGFGLDDLII